MTVYLYNDSGTPRTWNVTDIRWATSKTIVTWTMERVDHIRFVYTVVKR